MNLAVIGSGSREHAICYKLKQSLRVKNLICIPGNAGTQTIAKNLYGARKKVLINLNKLNWQDGFFRKDIGWRAIKSK
tara:strand:+ start:226 stop:459 length:234 start_codon:yes stop_codon:yes gene_type:complete